MFWKLMPVNHWDLDSSKKQNQTHKLNNKNDRSQSERLKMWLNGKTDDFECSSSTSWSSSVLVSGSDVHHWLKHNCVKRNILHIDCVAFLNMLHNFSFFFCFYQLSLIQPFSIEVVLCDDQKLWCNSIVLKYLMSLKYGLKSV